MTYNYLKVSNSIVKITRFSPVFCIVGLAVLVGCSADYRVRNDFRNVYDGLTDSYLVTLDYNLSSGQDYHADHIAVPIGGVFSFPTAITDPTLRRKENGITMVLESWNETPTGTGVGYDLGVSFDPVTESRTYYAQWTPIGGIGPAGGIVVYDKGDSLYGWRYLEMAVGASADQVGPWNSNIITQRSETYMDIGQGKWNTHKIVTQETYDVAIAAEIFNNYSIDSYHDWFLPSIHELQEAEAFLPDDTPYWSSTGYINTMNVLVFIKGQPSQSTSQDSDSPYARPFRAFKDEHPTVSVFYAANAIDATGEPPTDYNVYKAYDSGDDYEDEEAIIVKGQGTLVRPGFEFIGWCAVPGGSLPIATEGAALYSTDDMVLYAQWNPL